MLFFHLLFFFTIGTFSIAAPTGGFLLPGQDLKPSERPTSIDCIRGTISAIRGWHLPGPKNEVIEELTAGQWHLVRKHCFSSHFIWTHTQIEASGAIA